MADLWGPRSRQSCAAGVQDLISALFRHCPELDHEQLVGAMGSCEDANFMLWMGADWKRRRASP
jgi:hypothetical protein